MREELKQAIIKKAATEYAELPVQHSNALQGAVADQLAKGPRTIKRLALGGGLGLELRNDIQAYRAAEKKQTGSDKADTKEVKTAAVNAIINKVLK